MESVINARLKISRFSEKIANRVLPKKTGQKKPKKADFEINPAPDSILMTPTEKSCDTSLKQKLANLIASTPKTPTSKKRSRNTNNSFTSCKQIKFDNNLSSIAEDVLEEENHLNISSDDSFTSGQTCFNQMTIDDAEDDNVEIANISTIDLEIVKIHLGG
ncbi:hypothetical protein DPMN_028084 [Dreissena polymorpha]|uniref:Uncharacterized protein n=1 Tax=Dreissena polymorpha TaxID=45954 RepID=A0A9D4LYB0_DREPO|nr:hypothetical protein DPMN_028084 [Dreissena polymorpha]